MLQRSSTPRQRISKFDVASDADSRQLLTVRQVAALDNCSEKTVRRAITAGLLSVIRIGPGGRLVRITKSAHLAYRQTAML